MADTTSPDWLTPIRFQGDDRISFLQGQLTQDIGRLGRDCPALLAASCDPKGRVLAVLTLIYQPDSLIVALRRELAEQWLTGVLRYKLRSKVDALVADDVRVVAVDDAGIPHALAQWRFGSAHEALVSVGQASYDAAAQSRTQRLQNGVFDIAAHAVGGFTPHMLSLDQVDALSFSKGCYTGQEVVARTEHLGSVKRRARLFRATTPISDAAEQVAMIGDRKTGRLVAGAGDYAAIVVADKDANATHTLADGNTLQPAKPGS
ncbi:MAG: hypothetical protein AAFO81_02870 [Pseudomonadota bacterium]